MTVRYGTIHCMTMQYNALHALHDMTGQDTTVHDMTIQHIALHAIRGSIHRDMDRDIDR